MTSEYKFICYGCGILDYVEGGMKEPYCKKCFKEKFNNDYRLYIKHIKQIK